MNKILFSLFFAIISITNPLLSATILSFQSGDWNSNATWQGGNVPSLNDNVIILSGNAVTISMAGGSYVAVCKILTINGSLTYSGNRIVVGSPDPYGNPSSGGNQPLTVNGTLTISGDYQNSFYHNGNVVFNTGSTFNITSGFMNVNGNTGTPLSSVAAGTPVIDFTNATSFTANGGTLFITNPHIDAATSLIKGQKTFTDNSSVSFGAYVTPITNNDYYVDPATAPSFQTIELNYVSNTVKLAFSNIDIKGAVNINHGTLYNSDLSKTIRVGKDVNFGTGGRIVGKIELNGPIQQNINPNIENGQAISSAVIEGDVVANNFARVKIKLDLEILGNLIVSNGKFDLNNKTLTLQHAPLSATSKNYIVTHDLYQEVGILKIRNITSNTMFPVGTEQSYAPVFISALGGDFSVSAHPSIVNVPSDYSKINIEWDIKRISGTYEPDILVQWNEIDETTAFKSNRSLCKLYHHNGSIWEPMSSSTGPTTSSGNYFTKLAQVVKSFSTFTMLAPAVVPVTLTDFKGKIEQNNAHLYWETATEFNNAGFEIQKSLDAIQFDNIGFVKGNGNSFSSHLYSFDDINFTKSAYYRLKQTDFDGHSTFSTIVALQKRTNDKPVIIYPNPISTESFLTVELPEIVNNSLNIEIVDIQGRHLYTTEVEKGVDFLKIPVNNWARGIYIVHILNESKNIVSKFVKN